MSIWMYMTGVFDISLVELAQKLHVTPESLDDRLNDMEAKGFLYRDGDRVVRGKRR